MADTDLKVIIKASDLAEHSFIITSNCNRYPKKYRHTLVDRIQNISLDILVLLYEANGIDSVRNKDLKCETITKVISNCNILLKLIELSMKLNLLNKNSVGYWSKMVCDVKYMSIAWRTSERKR